MDLRGMPLSVVEAGVRALQGAETLRKWVEAYPHSDTDLLTDLAPVVEASILEYAKYQVLAEECGTKGSHDYKILTDSEGRPAGVVCAHCSTSWSVMPGRPESDAAPAESDEPPVSDPEPTTVADDEPPSGTVKISKLRPDPVEPPPAQDETVDAAVVKCKTCGGVVDTDDQILMKANAGIKRTTGQEICGPCMLTCADDPEHVISTYDQAVLSFMLYQVFVCKPCADVRHAAGKRGA